MRKVAVPLVADVMVVAIALFGAAGTFRWWRAELGPRGVWALTGREWSRLHAKHLDHHLKQFSA